MIDLIVSVADSYQEKVMEGLLPRIPNAAGTCPFTFKIIRNPGNDPGSYNDSHELLRSSIKNFQYCMVVFDFEGCGVDHRMSREEIELEVEDLLSKNGWENRNTVIVIAPELENWMWIESPHVESAIGWEAQKSLYDWARDEGLIVTGDPKPVRPKESFHKALACSRTPRSSSIYQKIAGKASFKSCTDPAFQKLIRQLQVWFPASISG